MATELNWKTVTNITAPVFASSYDYTKYHPWFLVQALIGANPLGACGDFTTNYSGHWKLLYMTSGSTSQSYSESDTSYTSSNLWMDADKQYKPNKVPLLLGNGGYDPTTAYYDPALESNGDTRRGLAVLKSPAINGRNYYMTVDMYGYFGYAPNTSNLSGLPVSQGAKIYLSADLPVSGSTGTARRPTANEHFSYFVNDQNKIHPYLGFDTSTSAVSPTHVLGHKHSLSLAADGSFYFFHTWNGADQFKALFGFTGLKNYSSNDSRAVMEIRVRHDEINLSTFAYNSGRGFTPASFVNMSGNTSIPSTWQPQAYNWWLDANVLSRATTFFRSPRHDGTSGGSTLLSSSVGVANHIVNVVDYTDVYSPMYGQSSLNSQYGEMPIIVGSAQIPANNGYSTLRGRVPDFKFAPNNLAQGSVRPNSGPFEYVKIAGFWFPWSSPNAPTM